MGFRLSIVLTLLWLSQLAGLKILLWQHICKNICYCAGGNAGVKAGFLQPGTSGSVITKQKRET